MPATLAGCQTCRLRRVKCDGIRPICQRCAKSRRVCQSKTVKQASFSIQLENLYASGETKRPRGPRPRSSLTLVYPTLDVSSRALSYYLNYYLYELPDLPTISACMSECLTAWKASKRECGMVDLAISALALAIFSRTQRNPVAANEAVAGYGRLLRVVQQQITQAEIHTCDGNRCDELILTVVLMAWYETTVHQPVNLKGEQWPKSLHSWSHHDGAMAILRVCHGTFGDKDPSSIMKQCRRGLVRSALLRNLSLPKWVRDGAPFGEHGIDLGFDLILVRVVNLRHALKKLKLDEFMEAEEIFSEAKELDEACLRWVAQIPSEWKCESHTILDSWSRTDFYSSTVYTCARHGFVAIWTQYFAARMLINSTLIRLVQLNQPPSLQKGNSTYDPQFSEYRKQLETMAENLVSTIPFALGGFSADKTDGPELTIALTLNADETIPPALALPIIWPLSVVSNLDGINCNHRLWIKAKLAQLGRVLGDGALECAGTEEWTHG